MTSSLIAAFLINRYTTPTYVVRASIFVSEPKDGNNSVSELLYGSEFFRNTQNLTNDIILLKSYSHINSTLKKLPYFKVYYYAEGNILTKELYKSSPIEVLIDSTSDTEDIENQLINCRILNSSQYQLSSENTGNLNAGDINYQFGKWYKFDKVRMKINRKSKSKFDEIKFKINNTESQTRRYIRKLNINPVERESSILDLNLEGETPNRDIDFLNQLIAEYITNDLKEKNLNAVKSIDFINEQLNEISDSLNTIELRLESFKRNNSGINLSAQNDELFNSLRQLDVEKSSFIIRNDYYNYLTNYIENQSFNESITVPSIYGIDDPILNSLVSEFVQIQQEIKLISNETNSEHPILQVKKIKREELSTNILELMNSLKAANNLNILGTQKRIENQEQYLKRLPELERRYINIQRMYNLSESLYLFLMEKKAEAGIAKSSNIPDVKWVDRAMVDGPPIKPQPAKNYLIALFLGLVLPIFFILILDYFNDKILYKEDLKKITDIPFLGLVGHESKNTSMVVINKPKSGVAESFRSIRSSINFLSADDEKKVFVFTSSISGEGKTFCSINLAGVFSLSDKKTLLIGADLRKPKLYADFEINQDFGLTNYLSGLANIDEIIQKTTISNLDIITSGPIPPNPSELLMSDKMSDLVALLKKEYDIIVIDSPPVGLVTDALVLMNYSDQAIYIVRQNYTPRHLIENTHELYASGKLKDICILFNDVKVTKYGYSYGYSYGYGYYSDDKKPNFLSRLFS